jgi:hypothetical protein
LAPALRAVLDDEVPGDPFLRGGEQTDRMALQDSRSFIKGKEPTDHPPKGVVQVCPLPSTLTRCGVRLQESRIRFALDLESLGHAGSGFRQPLLDIQWFLL